VIAMIGRILTLVTTFVAVNLVGTIAQALNGAEKLGYPSDARVVILGVSGMGWTYESNAAIAEALESAPEGIASDCMVVGPWFEDVATWRRAHPDADVGLSLTLLSEGNAYRFGPAGKQAELSGLIDEHGYLPGNLRRLEMNASPEVIEHELRAQIDRCLKAGIHPSHLMTHKGVLFTRVDLAEIYLRLAQEYWIPAVVVELSPEMLEEFSRHGLPMEEGMVELIAKYPLPKLDELRIVPEGDSYETKRAALLETISQLPPGLSQVHFRPAEESAALKRLTPRWQQMAWERQLLLDPEVRAALAKEGVILTDWQEVMQRFEGTAPPPGEETGATNLEEELKNGRVDLPGPKLQEILEQIHQAEEVKVEEFEVEKSP
jgi:predicted glycoside hydrolase/deacetylase ChbG (UPF0249 family)